MTMRPWRVGVCAAALFCLALPAAPAEPVPFADTDSIDDIRLKIELNGYDFTVDTNRVFNLSPDQKKSFFTRRSPAYPRLLAQTTDYGPLGKLLGDTPTNSTYCWTNVSGHSYIGPVRDQGDCGSCYSFGACAAAECTYNWAVGRNDANCVDFSESFIIWCLATLSAYSSHFSGCDGADYDYYELQALTVEGVTYESNFAYRVTDPGSCTHWSDPRITMSSWHRVPCNDIGAIKTAIKNFGAVDAAVKVTSAFQAYSSGIYQDSNTGCSGSPCEYTTSDHAISLVGWNDNGDATNNGYWILRNSWGASWGEKGYMRIKYKSAGVACAVAYFVYTNTPSTPPTAVTLPAANISSNSALLKGTVNPQGSASRYFFEYGTTTNYGSRTATNSAGSGTAAVSVSNAVSGLSPSTTYHVRLVATNANGRSNGSDESFTTAAATPQPPSVITDPATDVDNDQGTLRGRVNPNGRATGWYFQYGTTTNYGSTTGIQSAGDGTSLVSVDSNATGLAASTLYHFRLVATNVAGTVYGSNRTFTTTSGPQAPSAATLAASPVASDSATLNGTVNPNGSATAYWFEYGLTTAYGSTTTAASAGSGSGDVSVNRAISGLSAETTYHFRVGASNAVGRAYGADMSFVTPAVGDSLLSEDFEHGGAMPSGWTQQYVSGSAAWTFVTGDGGYGHPSAAHGGSYNACFVEESWVGHRTRLITPPINFGTRTNNATLTFWHYMEEWCYGGGCDQDELRVYYKTSAGGAWTLLATYDANVSAWTERILSLPNPNGTYYLAFEGTAYYGYGVCVDDVEVTGESAPSQPVPTVTTVDATGIASNGATLHGTVNPNGAATMYWFEYGTNTSYGNATPARSAGSGSSPVSVSTNLDKLASGKTYHFRCVASNSAGTAQGGDRTFDTTGSGPMTLLSEDFEHAGAMPSGWTQQWVSGSTNWIFRNGGADGYPPSAHGGSYNAYLFDDGYNNYETRLITPAVNFGSHTGQTTLTFWHYMREWAGDQDELRIEYKTSAGGSWTVITSFTASVSAWTQRTITLPNPGPTYYIAFRGLCKYGYGVCVDDVEVTGVSSGTPVSAPTVETDPATSVQSGSAILNGTVTPNGAPTACWFEYGTSTAYGASTAPAAIGTGSVPVAVNAPVGGLLPSTLYHFRAVATNSAGATQGSDLTFTTSVDTNVLLYEDFEHGGSLPSGWTQEYVSGSYYWEAVNGSYYSHPPSAHSGSYNALFSWYLGSTRLITPPVNFGTHTNAALLVFWHYMESYYKYQDELRVYYKTSAGGAWNLLASYDSSVAAWTKRVISLPEPGPTYYIGFLGIADNGEGVCIDDVQITGSDEPLPDPEFEPAAESPLGGDGFILRWSSRDDRAYSIFAGSNLWSDFIRIRTNLPSSAPVNTYTDRVLTAPQKFYRIEETLP